MREAESRSEAGRGALPARSPRTRSNSRGSKRAPLTTLASDLASPADYERLAPEFMEESAFAHVAGGSGAERTLQANARALAEIEIHSRVLWRPEGASTCSTLLGQSFHHPILLAPIGFQTLVHAEGELATATAAHAQRTGLVASSMASKPLEEIANRTTAPKWFQLYFQHNRAATRTLLERAEKAGYQAVVVTLDAPAQAPSYRALRKGFAMPDHVRPVNLDSLPPGPKISLDPEASVIFQGVMRSAPTWDDLAWLRRRTSLPIVAKGVSHPQDAKRLVEMGVQSIVVSNHGGRALDGMPASVHCLPTIRRAVGKGYPLLLDGGIRSGYDVFKAIAMGANAVMVGRLQIYALAVAGSLGVAHMLKMMRDELELAMALAGCSGLRDINAGCLFARETLWTL